MSVSITASNSDIEILTKNLIKNKSFASAFGILFRKIAFALNVVLTFLEILRLNLAFISGLQFCQKKSDVVQNVYY